jgi:hypothetical protein
LDFHSLRGSQMIGGLHLSHSSQPSYGFHTFVARNFLVGFPVLFWLAVLSWFLIDQMARNAGLDFISDLARI